MCCRPKPSNGRPRAARGLDVWRGNILSIWPGAKACTYRRPAKKPQTRGYRGLPWGHRPPDPGTMPQSHLGQAHLRSAMSCRRDKGSRSTPPQIEPTDARQTGCDNRSRYHPFCGTRHRGSTDRWPAPALRPDQRAARRANHLAVSHVVAKQPDPGHCPTCLW